MRQRLRDALAAEPRIDRRSLARALVELSGATAGKNPVGSKKSQLVKWLNGEHAISAPSGKLLAKAFQALGRDIPDDWFVASVGRELTWHDQMREIAEQSTHRYHEEVQKLRRQVERLRKEQAAMREEVLEEIRRLREAS